MASVETEPVHHNGDAADDPAIWIHPTRPAGSLIIGTDKQGGLAVYDLTGREVDYFEIGRINNVDVRYNFRLDGRNVDLILASDRTDEAIVILKMDPHTLEISPAGVFPFPVGINDAYGFCLYRSSDTGTYYAFVNDRRGDVEQWQLFGFSGFVFAVPVRSFSVGSITEGMVADDDHGVLYVAEENVGIWKYGAEPDAGRDRTLVDTTDDDGHLTADVEGLALYRLSDGSGYLIASSQGNSTFVIYQREGKNEYVGSFRIVGGPGIDGVTGTDGIDVSNANLGPAFPKGAFVAQDTVNVGDAQNFKLVPWESIAGGSGTPLRIDTRIVDPSAGTGDCTADGRVTVKDFATIGLCWTGPNNSPELGLGPQCLCMDLDGDDDVDLDDFTSFQMMVEH